MAAREKLSSEAKFLLREYALRVARKKHPRAEIDVQVGDYLDDDGEVERIVTISPDANPPH